MLRLHQGLGERAPQVEADRDDQQPDAERRAPAPARELVGLEHGRERQADAAPGEDRDPLADRRQAGEQRALARRRTLDEHGGHRPDLTTDGEALHEPR
jgi:hypothetical protein